MEATMSQLFEWVMNVIGGVFAGLIVLFLGFLYRLWNAMRFKKFFGTTVCDKYYVVYGTYGVPSEVKLPVPNSKVSRSRLSTYGINLDSVTSDAQARGVSYIVSTFGRNMRIYPDIASAADVDEKMDISFVSVGGFVNHKTIDLLDNPKNIFLDFDQNGSRIVKKETKEVVVSAGQDSIFDYGFIIKIHPEHNLHHTWICCAGFGTWGTSGAAYYLANRWGDIIKWAGYKSFGCVVKTRRGSDDSTVVIERLK